MLIKLHQRLCLAVLASSLLFVAPAFGEESLGIPTIVPYAEDSDVRQAIKDECELGEKMSAYLGKYIEDTDAVSAPPPQGQYLDVSITNVHAAGGGGFSGPKWMEVQGALIKDGKPIASFRAKRVTSGGGWGACGAAQRCAKAISKDISKWLQNPEDGAKLGDAK